MVTVADTVLWGGGNMSTTVNVQNYIAGSLIIEVAASQGNKLLWEGIDNQDIDAPSKTLIRQFLLLYK